MKKVLIIANLFHASPRIPGIAKYLKDFGWDPTIITVPITEDPRNLLAFPEDFKKEVRIIETPYSEDVLSFWRKIFIFLGFKKEKSILSQIKEKTGIKSKESFFDYIFNLYLIFFAYPDEQKKWKKPALQTIENLLKKEKFDTIISSSSPVTAHIIAKKIKKEHKISWLADLRDLWTQNHNYPYPWWRKIFEMRLEKKTLLSADSLVTVSVPLAERLKEIHKGKEIFSVTNGFFPEDVNFPPYDLTKKFTITYTGTIYTRRQDPKDLFIAIKELISEGLMNRDNVEIRFYSDQHSWIEKEIQEYGLEDLAKVYEKVPRTEILKKQKESQVLLLIYFGEKKEKGWQSLKIFGYLAAQRPILTIGGDGGDVVEKMVMETKSGAYCKNINDIKEALRKFYLEYKNNGRVSYDGKVEKIKNHSYKKKAGEFARILEKTIASPIGLKFPQPYQNPKNNKF